MLRSWAMMEAGGTEHPSPRSAPQHPSGIGVSRHVSPQLTSSPLPCRNFLQNVMFAGGSNSPYAKAMRGQITLSQVSPRVPVVEHHRCLGWGSGRSRGEQAPGWAAFSVLGGSIERLRGCFPALFGDGRGLQAARLRLGHRPAAHLLRRPSLRGDGSRGDGQCPPSAGSEGAAQERWVLGGFWARGAGVKVLLPSQAGATGVPGRSHQGVPAWSLISIQGLS